MSKKVYDFWAPWCGPCKVMKPIIEEFRDKMGFELVEINVDEDDDDISSKYKVINIPTIIIVDENEKEVARHIGSIPKTTFEEFLTKNL